MVPFRRRPRTLEQLVLPESRTQAAAQQAAPDPVSSPHEKSVRVFFYGSYINPDVLAEAKLFPSQLEVARLEGFQIVIRPLANLDRSDRHSVHGVLTCATHAELARLYEHASQVLGGVYLPEAVLVVPDSGPPTAALCYISQTLKPAPASNEYIDRIVTPARRYGFPAGYVEHLESFRP